MIIKRLFSFFAALIFLIPSLVAMEGVGTPLKKAELLRQEQSRGDTEFFTSQQQEINEERGRGLRDPEEKKSGDESSLQQREIAVKAVSETGSEFQTPPKKAEVKAIHTEPPPVRPKASDLLAARNQLSRKDNPLLDLDQAERTIWLGNDLTTPFSQSKRELSQEKIKQEIEKELTDPQKIRVIRESFITTLEKCYGQEFVEELFNEGGKEKFLAQNRPLSLEDAAGLIALADAKMAQGKSYLKNSQELAVPLQKAVADFDAAQVEAEQAQQNYDDLNGSPWQHLLA
ncbi:MAG: hypothetical protein FJ390_05320, partial [Verrucomicrobia bacterium]|nr:hypothetical protein [Verrucomicrobiota bacterium]